MLLKEALLLDDPSDHRVAIVFVADRESLADVTGPPAPTVAVAGRPTLGRRPGEANAEYRSRANRAMESHSDALAALSSVQAQRRRIVVTWESFLERMVPGHAGERLL